MYSETGYVNKKGLQNGGSNVQFGSNRERAFQGGPGTAHNWTGYSYNNGYREEVSRRGGMRPPPPGPAYPPHYHEPQPQPQPQPHPHPQPHLQDSPNYLPSHHQDGPHSYDYEGGEYQRRPEFYQHGGASYEYPPPGEDRSQVRFNNIHGAHGRQYDSYPSPTMSSSSWSPTVESPESPLLQKPTPPLPMRGRGGGGRAGHPPPPRHALEDSGFPPHGQRRTLLPTQKLTFHNTRPHDMALQHGPNRIADRGMPGRPRPRRGGFLPAVTGWGEERHRPDVMELDSLSDQANRDPRLQRKSSQPLSAASAVPKRKQDVHLLVHQILSEHSYCKGRSEGDPDLEEAGKKTDLESDNTNLTHKTILPSTFLSYVEDKVMIPASSMKRTRLAKKKRDIPNKVDHKLEVPADEIPDPLKLIGSCTKHQSQLNLFCKTCRELICVTCASSDSHLNHDHYVLNKVLGGGKNSSSLKALAVELKVLACELKGNSKKELKSEESELKVEASELKMEAVEERTEGDEIDEDGMEYLPPVISLAGFELDLDTEPSSSEDEGMEEEGGGKESYIISLPSKLSHVDGRYFLTGTSSQVEDARDSVSLENSSKLPGEMQLPGEMLPQQWSITNFDVRKNLMRFSKVDLVRGTGPFQGVMNGQVLPKKLALFASNSSPSGSSRSDPASPRRDWDGTDGIPGLSDREGDLESHSSSVETFAGGSLSSVPDHHMEDYVRGVSGGGDRGYLTRKRRRRWEKRKWESMHMSKRRTRKSDLLNDSAQGSDTLEPSEQTNTADASESPEPKRNGASRRRSRRTTRSSSRIPFKEFTPEILTTRSRAETATMRRRHEMEKEIERNERERILTARPEDLIDLVPSPISMDLDDSVSSEAMSSHSFTSSSIISSRDIDGSSIRSNASILDDFSPDVIARCKRISTARNSGDTPLHKVCRTGKYEMARYLIQVDNLPVNAQDNAGWTPLHEASCSCHNRLAELLLKAGADANMSAADGTRPIHDAIESGNLDMVKLLLSYGADPMAEIGEKTPVEFALSNNQMEIHAFLEFVIKERMKQRVQKTPVSSPSPTVHKKPTRASKKDELFKDASKSHIAIPVDGYGPDGPNCGEELSYPLFYVTPIIELSDSPFLPVYNFKLVSGNNPRTHNFHLISDILDHMDMTEAELLQHCNKVLPLEMSVAHVMQQLETSNTFYQLPDSIMAMPYTKKLRFLPLCSQLRQLLDIEVENLDD